MKKITRNILTYVITCSMMISLCACGKNDSRNSDEEETVAETEETEVTSSETTETTEETTAETEPASTVWGEINDLTYGISELTLTNYIYSKLDEEEIEGSGVEEEAVYSIPSVDVSEPDEDGYVTYIIDYNTNGTYDIEFAFDVADHTDGWSSNPQQYNVIDYYTGTILCNWEDSYNDDGEEIAVTINNGDEEITVYVSAALELTVNENESFDVDDDHWGWHVDYTIYSTITLRAPQSYDGMLLEIDTTGWTEADHLEDIASGDDEAEVAEGDIFTDDLNDCRFTWASDLIIEG